MTLTSLSQRPKSHEPETKSDTGNDEGLANNETENVPKRASASFTQYLKTLKTDTQSEAEENIGLTNNRTENRLSINFFIFIISQRIVALIQS